MVDAALAFESSQKPIDFVAASAAWASAPLEEPEFTARLRFASMTEALRPDSNTAIARDLHLASEAARALNSVATTRPSIESPKAYPAALAAMLAGADPKASAEARAQMQAWASLSQSALAAQAEADTLIANAATTDKDFVEAAHADHRRDQSLGDQKPAAEISAARQRAEDALKQKMMESREIDRLEKTQVDLQSRSAKAATTQESQQIAQQQSSLAAELSAKQNAQAAITEAARSATKASKMLSEEHPDVAGAAREQSTAAASLSRAAAATIHDANLARLSTLPGLWSIFRSGGSSDTEPESRGQTSARPWARLSQKKPGEVNTASRAPDPPGYQEALRAYFNALGMPASPQTEQDR